MKEKFYITTPIYYPSASFHVGHCYCTINADAIARYKRLKGYDVFFLTGTDEHGQKIELKAMENGVTPQEYVDKIVADSKLLWKELKISNDNFIRTTDEKHKKVVQKIFRQLYEQGDIYKGKYAGMYCTPCESFWTESQLDEDGNCPDCHRVVHLVQEDAYFFKLGKYQDQLVEYIEDHPEFIEPISRKNEMFNNFIKPGLEDLCVSRTSFKWGIPVDFDDEHVIYVWIDALSNYLTALNYGEENDELYQKYWAPDLQLVGKEITRFHVIIWPIMLMALGLELPKKVFGHGWLVIDGGKISKSLGNYKDPREYVRDYGVDALRYFVLREVAFGNDGNFSEELLISRTNTDLANNLGNLVSRTVAMVHKYFDGIVVNDGVNLDIDSPLIEEALALNQLVDEKMNEVKPNEALELIFDFLKNCNKYIDETTPWVLAKDEDSKKRLSTVLYNLLESIRIVAVFLQAFIPDTAERIFEQLNCDLKDVETTKEFGHLKVGTKLNESAVLFQRIEGNK